ncbi:MAG: phosphoenolpyruvate synthase, partial [Actinomycetales bacterium]|nr:phosphoenolpyruvate synthase [Actinomycetales bacterium]
MTQSIRWFSELGMADLEQVGGKNASLGEMVSHLTRLGVQVPDGFATTSEVYREFLGATGLAERIDQRLTALDTDDTIALAEAGREIRELVIAQPF